LLVATKAFNPQVAITVSQMISLSEETQLKTMNKRTYYKVLNSLHTNHIADYILKGQTKAWYLQGYMTFSKYAYSHDFVPALQPKTRKGLEI
jgi:hypothetical protein